MPKEEKQSCYVCHTCIVISSQVTYASVCPLPHSFIPPCCLASYAVENPLMVMRGKPFQK